MKQQLNLNLVRTWREDSDVKVILQDVTDWEGDSVHVHIELKKKFNKSLYKKLIEWYNTLKVEHERIMTIVEPDDGQILLVQHMGFYPTHLLDNGSILFRGGR